MIPPLEIGAVVADKYRIERLLARGGMGVIYVAEHLSLHERFAIKVLRHELRSERGSEDRLLREARAAVRIKSDHVVRVFDVGLLDDGSPYIVMELLLGMDLEALIEKEAPLPLTVAVDHVLAACEAVASAHALGIVHRDLKPANIFLARTGQDHTSIKVLDFGLAQSGPMDVPEADELRGSPLYMAPEQIDGATEIDARGDVWSLGVILFELLVGVGPFVAPSLSGLFRLIRERPTPNLRDARSDAPIGLQAVIERCLAKRPEDRFRDAEELRAALAPFGSSSPQAVDRAPTPSALVAPKTPAPPPVARRGFLFVAGVLAVAALVGLASYAGPSAREATRNARNEAHATSSTRKIACIPFRPGGWLGAAAAAIACLRAELRAGGRSDSTLTPAELLELPHVPSDAFPAAPYDAPDVRERALAFARAHGARILDGEVRAQRGELSVSMTLEREDGEAVAPTEGRGHALYEAVRAAMRPIVKSGAIATAPPNDSFLSEWYRVRGGDAAEAVADVSIAIASEDEPATTRECAAFVDRTDVLPDLAFAVAQLCAPLIHRDATRPVPILDARRPSELAALVSLEDLAHTNPASDWRARAEALNHARSSTTAPEARALLSARSALALYDAGESLEVQEAALLVALHEDPKTIDFTGGAWKHLAFVSHTESTPRAITAWAPWNPRGHQLRSTFAPDAESKLAWLRIANTLSPDAQPAWFAERLLREGLREEARLVATRSDYVGLKVHLQAADARFAAALAMAAGVGEREPSAHAAKDELYAAAIAADVSLVLGRSFDARAIFEKYVQPSPSRLQHLAFGPRLDALYVCARAEASVAGPCMKRFSEMVEKGSLPDTLGFASLVKGASALAAGDATRAANAWRPLLRENGEASLLFSDLFAETFQRAGEEVLASELDAKVVLHPGRFNGAELAYVREARRAEKRGDKARAAKLARAVVDAWSMADEVVPLVAEMRAMLARVAK